MPLHNKLNIAELAQFVLNLDLNDLASTETVDEHTPIKPKVNNFDEFYSQYQPLILDEVVGTLKSALNKIQGKNGHKVYLNDNDEVHFYAHEGVTLLNLVNDKRINFLKEGGSHFIVSVINLGQIRAIAILNIYQDEYQLAVKGDFSALLNEEVYYFEMSPLASFTTTDRMYSVCVNKPKTDLLKRVMQASVSPWPEMINNAPETTLSTLALNPEQQSAVKGFINATEGLYLLQGPPGTGKTTTIVAMIQNLAARDERTLVCAPSNKAIQVIAERTHLAIPFEPLLLIAVEAKITSSSLQEISFDNWVDRFPNKLKALLQELKIDALLPKPEKDAAVPDVAVLIRYINNLETKSKEIKEISRICLRYATKLSIDERMHLISTIDNILQQHLTALQILYKQISADAFPTLLSSPATNTNNQINTDVFFKQLVDHYQLLNTVINHHLLPQVPRDQKTLLESAKILFCTLSITGRVSLQREYSKINPPFHNIIIDEAGQAVEAETLIPFGLAKNAKKALLVGDTRQLPATTFAPSSKRTLFDCSMMWRLLEVNTQPYHALAVQYRMRPTIRHFPSSRYYNDGLKDHESIAQRTWHLPAHMYSKHGLKNWIDINGQEERDEMSFINRAEASSILEIVRAIREYDTTSHIGIISFYGAQVGLIRKLLNTEKSTNRKINPDNIAVHTVDGFQGDEKDIIIISFVRANQHNQIGFLSDFRRLNVAITRAKDALYILGKANTFKNAPANEVSELLDFLRKTKSIKSFEEILNQIRNKNVKTGAPAPTFSLPNVSPIQNVTAAVMQPLTNKPKPITPNIVTKAQLYNDNELVDQAGRYYENMQYEKAIKNYTIVLERQSKRPDIYQSIANCHKKIGNVEQAQLMQDIATSLQNDAPASPIETIPPTTTTYPTEYLMASAYKRNIKVSLKKARELSDQGEYKKAEQAYIKLHDETPENSEILLGLGWVLHKQRENEKAARYFELSLTLIKSPLAYQGLIQCKKILGDTELALDLACEGLDYFPWSKTIQGLKASLEQLSPPIPKATPPAVPEVKPTALRPLTLGDFLPQNSAKTIQLSTKIWDKSKQASSASSSKPIEKPLSASALIELRQARKLSQDKRPPEEYEPILQKLYEQYPHNNEILLELGWCLHILRDNEQAIPLFEECLEKTNHLEAYYGLARCYRFTDDIPRASALIEQSLAHHPNDKKIIKLKEEIANLKSHAISKNKYK